MFKDGFAGDVYQGETITTEVDGFTVTATIYTDDNTRCPWEDADGHGVVSGWTTRAKRPGERVLCGDGRGGSKRFYDVEATTALAKRDGWGPRLPHRTTGQARAAAVEADFKFLKGWCDDDWCYVGVAVTVSHEGVDLTGEYDHALWGIESIAGDHCTEVANEMIDDAIEAARHTIKRLTA